MNINTFDGFFDNFECFKQPITLYKVSTTTNDFIESHSIEVSSPMCVVTPQNPASLNISTIDYAKEYYKLRSPVFVDNNNYVQYNGKNFRVIQYKSSADYGFYNAVIEEQKQPIPGVA